MNKILQIQFTFLAVEDRLLLKINTRNKEEFSFLLTRRFVSLLYPVLTKILYADKSINIAQNTETGSQRNKQIQQEKVKLQQQEALENTDTTSPYQDNELTHPLGVKPILLANISTQGEAEQIKLSLTPEKGQGVSLSIDQNLTHLLRNLLLESIEGTSWELKFQADYISTSTATQPDKKLLH